MPVFNCFFKIIWKNRIAILIYIAIFVPLSVMIANMSASSQEDIYKDTAISIAVIDRDKSVLSESLTAFLGERHNLNDLPDNTEKLQDALFYRSIEYILFIPAGFEENITEGSGDMPLEDVKLPNSTSGIYLDNQIDGYMATLKAYLAAGYELPEAIQSASSDMHMTTNVKIYSIGEEAKPGEKSAFYFQFLPYIIIAVIISALSPVLIAFNRSDLAERTESSSFKLRERNTQIALGCAISAVIIWFILIAASLVLYGNEILSKIGGLRILNSFAFLAVSVCIAFLLGQCVKKTVALSAANNIVSLCMSFLCGIFVPQSLLGSGVLSIAKFLPAYWYIRSNDMLLNISDFSAFNSRIYMEGIGIQLGFAAAIFTVALVISRQKKMKMSL